LISPHSTWNAAADGRPVTTVSPQAAASAAFSWVIVMICGAGRPSIRCLTALSWKNASSLPETNHSRSIPFSFIEATSASADCCAGIRYSRPCCTAVFTWTCVAIAFTLSRRRRDARFLGVPTRPRLLPGTPRVYIRPAVCALVAGRAEEVAQ
jgi:hypothetical protein